MEFLPRPGSFWNGSNMEEYFNSTDVPHLENGSNQTEPVIRGEPWPCGALVVSHWMPHVLLWVCLPVVVLYLRLTDPTPRNILYIRLYGVRIVLAVCYLLAYLIELVNELLTWTQENLWSATLSALVNILSLVLVGLLVVVEMRRGVHPSIVPWGFWLLTLSAEFTPLRTLILQDNYAEVHKCESNTFHMARVSVLVVTFGWCLVTDILLPTRLFMTDRTGSNIQQINGHETTNLLSRVTFTWILRQELQALSQPISLLDLFLYKLEHGCKNSLKKLDLWIKRQTKHQFQHCFKAQAPKRPSLVIGVLRLVMPSVLVSFSARCLGLVVRVTQLFILRDLIKYLEIEDSGGRDIWRGLYLTGRLAINNILMVLLCTHYFYSTNYASARVRGILSALVIRKVLSLPAAQRLNSIGDMTTYMTLDIQKVAAIFSESNCGFEVFILGPAAIFILWQAFGPSCVIAIVIYLVLVFLNTFPLRRLLQRIKAGEMITKVQRVGLIQSILSGIKVLKFNAWEEIYEKKILKTRQKELNYMKKSISVQAASDCFSLLVPYLVTTSALFISVLVFPSHPVSSEKIFVAMTALDNSLIYTIYLPIAATFFAQGYVSGKRLTAFLRSTEDHQCSSEGKIEGFTKSNEKVVKRNGFKYSGVSQKELSFPLTIPGGMREKEDLGHVSLVQASFTWSDPCSPTLKSLNLEVCRGQCVAVVGSVGAGKSSLLTALLGEMTQLSGTSRTTGTIGYVPQEPWILQASIKDNITLGSNTCMEKMSEVIHACALESDLQTLKDGIHTEIGEQGVTLSGGQKHRVSLARALYADADVYLLDDPISAVDANVAKHLFEQVIGPRGLLQNKTRILVTHALQWLPLVDLVVIMAEGQIVDSGSYAELESRNSLLSNCFHLNKNLNAENALERRYQGMYEATDKDPNTPSIMTTEIMDHKKTSVSTLLTYFRSMGQGRAAMILVFFILLAITMSSSNIWVTLWSAEWKADPISATKNAYYRLGIHMGLGALHTTVMVVALVFMARSSLNAARNLHNDLLQRLLHATLTFFDTTPVGRILNWFTKDTDDIDINIPKEVCFLVYSVPAILSMLAISTYVVPASLLLTLPMLVGFIAIQRLYTTYVRQMKRIDGVTKSPVFSFFSETVRGVVSIRAYRQEAQFFDTFCCLVDDSTRPIWHISAAKGLMVTAISIISAGMSLCVSTLCVVYRDQLNSVLCAVAIYCTMQGMFTLQSFVRHTANLECALVAVERVSSHNHITKEAPWHLVDGAPVHPQWPQRQIIRFQNYSTAYRPDLELVLRDINFTIKASEKVGIVGRTGAGKTSLTLALLRMLEPRKGKIYIDDVDITQIGLHELRSKVTVITQDPVLFEGNIRDNLDPQGNHSDTALWEALEQAHLKDFLTASPGGLSWYCGDSGELMSVGQRQLLCLARALLRKSQIIVLDEPTAAVDVVTDNLVQEMLRTHLGHCTLLTIAHRINTVMDYDRVMVIEAGRIVEFKAPAHLLADKNFYSLALEAGQVHSPFPLK